MALFPHLACVATTLEGLEAPPRCTRFPTTGQALRAWSARASRTNMQRGVLDDELGVLQPCIGVGIPALHRRRVRAAEAPHGVTAGEILSFVARLGRWTRAPGA
jgi:hypothetical protein